MDTDWYICDLESCRPIEAISMCIATSMISPAQPSEYLDVNNIVLNRKGCVPATSCGISSELRSKLQLLNILADDCHGHELYYPPSRHANYSKIRAGRRRWRKRGRRGGRHRRIFIH